MLVKKSVIPAWGSLMPPRAIIFDIREAFHFQINSGAQTLGRVKQKGKINLVLRQQIYCSRQ